MIAIEEDEEYGVFLNATCRVTHRTSTCDSDQRLHEHDKRSVQEGPRYVPWCKLDVTCNTSIPLANGEATPTNFDSHISRGYDLWHYQLDEVYPACCKYVPMLNGIVSVGWSCEDLDEVSLWTRGIMVFVFVAVVWVCAGCCYFGMFATAIWEELRKTTTYKTLPV